jgi:hypothetical protein
VWCSNCAPSSPGGLDDASGAQDTSLDGTDECGLGFGQAKMHPIPPPMGSSVHGSLLPAGLRATWAQDQNLNAALKRALCLLSGGDPDLVHPVGGGCMQSVKKCSRCGHVLAGLGKGGAR